MSTHHCCNGTHHHHAPTVEKSVHEFWTTQPVEVISDDRGGGPIEKGRSLEEVRSTSYPLPLEFEWVTVDISDADEMDKLYTLLKENYVEDQDAMFRFEYSRGFLSWALCADLSTRQKEWLVGVQVKSTGRLVGFISAVPGRMRLDDHDRGGKTVHVAEVNFLCVHKKLRSKRLAPVLIKEVTRRVNLCNIWQAVYTAGVEIPTPVASPRYYHRLLNVRKLVEIGFASVPVGSTLTRQVRLLNLPTEPNSEVQFSSKQLKPMEKYHVKQVGSLLREYLKQFKYAPEMTNEEISHWLLMNPGLNDGTSGKVVYCYVKENDNNKVTDFVSFYHLPSQCLSSNKETRLEAVYLFYTVATSVSMKSLIEAALHIAHIHKFDVFNCLDIMNNHLFLDELKFGKGDGILNYYCYNYRLPQYTPQDIGLILL